MPADVAGAGTVFRLLSAGGTTALSVHVHSGCSDDFREHLSDHGFHIPTGQAKSVVSEVVVAAAANPAAWTAVGGAIVAFLYRHRGKVHRVEAEDTSITLEGYSAKEAERLVAGLFDQHRPAMTLGDRAEHTDIHD